jgi:hypothetical protein
VDNTNDFRLWATIPGNMTARVFLPAQGASNPVAIVDGSVVSGTLSNSWLVLDNIASGQLALWVRLALLSSSRR